jgi:MFS family permease
MGFPRVLVPKLGLRNLGYRWVIFGLSFNNLMAEGGISNMVPVVYVALQAHFGWSATATSGIFSTAGLVGAVSAPFMGRLLDRTGPRFVLPLGGLLILIGYLSTSFVTELWQLFILYSVVVALGELIISDYTTAATLAPWFPRIRGRILGLADAGNALGQFLFLPLAALLIATIGWRDTFRIFGVLFFLLVAPTNFLLQRRPPVHQVVSSISTGQRPETQPVSEPVMAESLGMRQVLRRPPVWFLVQARVLATLAIWITRVHIVAFFVVAGYSPLLAASAIGAAGLVGLVGRPIIGALSDSFGREVVYTFGLGLQSIAVVIILILGDGQSLWPLILFVALSGLVEGISSLIIGAKAADLFPANILGSVMGLMQMGQGLGVMVGPLIGGVLFDLQGNYVMAFTLVVVLKAVSIGCMWMARFTGGVTRY